MTDSIKPLTNLLHSLPTHSSSWSISRWVRIITQGYLGAGSMLIYLALPPSFPASPITLVSLSTPHFVLKCTFLTLLWNFHAFPFPLLLSPTQSPLLPSPFRSSRGLTPFRPLKTSRHGTFFAVGFPRSSGVTSAAASPHGSQQWGTAPGWGEKRPPLPPVGKERAATACPHFVDSFRRRSSSAGPPHLTYPHRKPLYLSYSPWDSSPEQGRWQWHSFSPLLSPGPGDSAQEPPFPSGTSGEARAPSHAHLSFPNTPHLFRATLTHTKAGEREENAKGGVSLRKVRRTGAVPRPPHTPLGCSPLTRRPPGADTACFSLTDAHGETKAFPRRHPGAVYPLHGFPCSPTAPAAEVTLTRFSARREPALLPCPPAPPADTPLPQRRDGCSPALPRWQPTAPAGPSDRHRRHLRCVTPAGRPGSPRGKRPPARLRPPPRLRPWQRAANLRAVLQSLFQEEFVDGGHVGAAGRWELGCAAADARWHAPAAGLGRRPSPRGRPRLCAGSGARRLAGSAGGGGGGSPGPLTPPSSRPPEEASHGEGRRQEGARQAGRGGRFLPPLTPRAWPAPRRPRPWGWRAALPRLQAAGAGMASRSPASGVCPPGQ